MGILVEERGELLVQTDERGGGHWHLGVGESIKILAKNQHG